MSSSREDTKVETDRGRHERSKAFNICINFPNLDQILTFDGKVIEVFYGTKSARVHIGHLENIEVTTDHKGNRELHIEAKFGAIPYMPFEPALASDVNALIVKIRNVTATFHF